RPAVAREPPEVRCERVCRSVNGQFLRLLRRKAGGRGQRLNRVAHIPLIDRAPAEEMYSLLDRHDPDDARPILKGRLQLVLPTPPIKGAVQIVIVVLML